MLTLIFHVQMKQKQPKAKFPSLSILLESFPNLLHVDSIHLLISSHILLVKIRFTLY